MKVECEIYQSSSGAICGKFDNGAWFVLHQDEAEKFDLESIEGFSLQKFLEFYE